MNDLDIYILSSHDAQICLNRAHMRQQSWTLAPISPSKVGLASEARVARPRALGIGRKVFFGW